VLTFYFQDINGKYHTKIDAETVPISAEFSICFQLKARINFLQVLASLLTVYPLSISPAEEVHVFYDVVFKNTSIHLLLFLCVLHLCLKQESKFCYGLLLQIMERILLLSRDRVTIDKITFVIGLIGHLQNCI
jgi:hypothetical protein